MSDEQKLMKNSRGNIIHSSSILENKERNESDTKYFAENNHILIEQSDVHKKNVNASVHLAEKRNDLVDFGRCTLRGNLSAPVNFGPIQEISKNPSTKSENFCKEFECAQAYIPVPKERDAE